MSDKPLASLCIPFYNQVDFVEDTVKGALSQDYENLEIIFTDDCSSDGTFDKIKELVGGYKGPHKILLNRNNPNMGLVPHTNKYLFEISKGDFIFLNGGDDISMPDRIKNAVDVYLRYPNVMAVTFSDVVINKSGKETGEKRSFADSITKISDPQFISSNLFMAGGAALSFRRDVLNKFGRMNDDCQTEDSVLRFRSLLIGDIYTSSKVGLKYRVHDNNISRYISTFKTNLIANQYEKDLKCVEGVLRKELYSLLEEKINFYRKYRRLEERREVCQNPIKRKYMNIILKLNRYIYKIGLLLHKNEY